MLKIEITETKVQGKKQKIPYRTVNVNGLIEENPKCNISVVRNHKGEQVKIFSIEFTSLPIIQVLLNATFDELENYLGGFNFTRKIDFYPDLLLDISIKCNRKDAIVEGEYRKTIITLKPTNKERWKNPYSIEEALNAILSIIEQKNSHYETSNNMFGGSRFCKVTFYHETYLVQTSEGLDEAFEIIESAIRQADTELRLINEGQILTTSFTFPQDVKSACLQYLIYFGQFLEDLGIEANTELKDEANHTLFTIVPKNKSEGLEKIREALNLYLNAPGANNFDVDFSSKNDIAFVQWAANVQHLKTQMMMLTSAIQMKDATIQYLQLTNYELSKKLLEVEKKTYDEEEVIPGVVSIKKYDGKWFSINLPKILKWLKRK